MNFWTMKKLTMNLSSYECVSYEKNRVMKIWNERIPYTQRWNYQNFTKSLI